MKRTVKNIVNPLLSAINKSWYQFDKKIIIPITKGILMITDLFKDNKRRFEHILSKKNTLVFVSLILALILFFVVDKRANLFIESSAEVLYQQPVKAIYNEEAYVVEGLPETVDITLIGRRSDLYLAKQLPIQEVSVDLSDLKPGTHKVNIKYKQPLTSIDYKLDPSFTTVVIYPKISVVKDLTIDILHIDKLDPRLYIEKMEAEKSEVIIKGAQYKLDKVASVKALVDIEKLVNKEVGETLLKDIPLIAYDEAGNRIDVEIVPSKINATMAIASPNKTVPIKVIPVGNVTFGKAIESINIDKTEVTIYGDEALLDEINYIPIEIDVDGLKTNKDFNIAIKKPTGIRYLSITNVKVSVLLDSEINKEVSGIKIEYRNLGKNLVVHAVSQADTEIAVILKGSERVINEFDTEAIHAYVDLGNYTVGEHEVDVVVYGDDVRITYVPKVKRIRVKIVNQ
jgi:YbbR domain-containing protein